MATLSKSEINPKIEQNNDSAYGNYYVNTSNVISSFGIRLIYNSKPWVLWGVTLKEVHFKNRRPHGRVSKVTEFQSFGHLTAMSGVGSSPVLATCEASHF